MSYDIRIWSSNPIDLQNSCPANEGWLIENSLAHYTKDGWQIIVTDSAKLETEDIPEEALTLIANLSYLTEVVLEPGQAPTQARAIMNEFVKSISCQLQGVIEDSQEGSFYLYDLSGVKHTSPAKKKKARRFSLLEMSWWFNETPAEKKALLKQLIDYFESNLPEALPRRYGLYEPPQYKYLKAGKLQFIEFLDENDMVVWYPTKPVLGIHMSFIKQAGVIEIESKAQFQTNHFSIAFDLEILKQSGKKAHLEQVFKDVSKLFKPFYGEIRLLHHYIDGGVMYYADSRSDHHPVREGWWVGIPQHLPQAIMVGEVYLNLWAGLKEKGEMIDSLCFVSLNDWNKQNLESIIGDVPSEIAQLQSPKYLNWLRRLFGKKPLDYSAIYPKNFPFKNIKLG